MTQLTDLLGGPAVLGPGVVTNLDLAEAVRRGLPALCAVHVRSAFGNAITTYLHVKLERDILTPSESDLLVRVTRILGLAADVLGSPDRAVGWLNEPNAALGGVTPASLLDTSVGEHEVETTLQRIEHGIYG